MAALRQFSWRWIRFSLVGTVGFGVQLTLLAGFVSGLHVNYLVATALSVEAAILHNFFLHKKITWLDRVPGYRSSWGMKLLKFNLLTGVLSIPGNLLLMRFFVGTCGLHYLIANLFTIASCAITNFLLSDRIVFAEAAGPGCISALSTRSNGPSSFVPRYEDKSGRVSGQP